MTCKIKNTQFDLAMELLIENGFNGMTDTIGIMVNAAMRIERSRFLKADPYERTEKRQGYAHGY